MPEGKLLGIAFVSARVAWLWGCFIWVGHRYARFSLTTFHWDSEGTGGLMFAICCGVLHTTLTYYLPCFCENYLLGTMTGIHQWNLTLTAGLLSLCCFMLHLGTPTSFLGWIVGGLYLLTAIPLQTWSIIEKRNMQQ